MKYFVYVIEDSDGRKYTGYTSNFEKRLWQHNNGVTFTTKKGRNWRPIYSEEYPNKTKAIKREKFLKSGKGREFIKKHCGIV